MGKLSRTSIAKKMPGVVPRPSYSPVWPDNYTINAKCYCPTDTAVRPEIYGLKSVAHHCSSA
jgi:hypothetical protein